MTEDSQETRRHRYMILGIVAIVSALIGTTGGGVGATYAWRQSTQPPPPPSIREIADAMGPIIAERVQSSLTEAMRPYQAELARAKIQAEEAKNDAFIARNLAADATQAAKEVRDMMRDDLRFLVSDMKTMADKMTQTREDIAFILGQTKAKPGG